MAVSIERAYLPQVRITTQDISDNARQELDRHFDSVRSAANHNTRTETITFYHSGVVPNGLYGFVLPHYDLRVVGIRYASGASTGTVSVWHGLPSAPMCSWRGGTGPGQILLAASTTVTEDWQETDPAVAGLYDNIVRKGEWCGALVTSAGTLNGLMVTLITG